MNLSILPVSLFGDIMSGKMSIAEWAQLAQDSGADGYDISSMFLKNHTATYIAEIERDLAARNIRIQPTMVCCYPDFTNPDRMERERQLDYLRSDIAISSKFGFKYMRITAGMNHPGIDFGATCRTVADCFGKAAEIASNYGIQLVFENHAQPGAWPLIDFSFNPEAFLTICREMRNTGVGVNFDTANAQACGEDPAVLLEKVIDQVVTIHMNDTTTIGDLSPVMIGTGLVNFDAVFQVLRKHSFSGWVCIEEASDRGASGIREAIRYARKYVGEERL